jgi:ATP-dependent RNA helicase DDX1
LLVIGGVNVKEQISTLQNVGADIIVGTPGRLEDLIQGGYLALSNCRFFVLDEADGLLKQGYTELIERLHRQMPKITADGRRLQMIVCSATLHAFEVKKMAVSEENLSKLKKKTYCVSVACEVRSVTN